VQQKSFSLVVLVPLELCAAIDGVKPERQEGKYDRFEVAVTTTLADRATVDGPILKMHSVDVSAWGERHVFFRLASGDSVYTKSLKLTELFPEESNPDQPLAMP
jgi:hypothetical protein